VLDESSSSPSGKLVTSVRKKKGASSALLVEAEDGSSFFCLPDLATRYDIRRGVSVAVELWQRLLHESELVLCYNQGVSLLTRREHTRRELELGLQKRGYSPAAIRSSLDTLTSQGYISHHRFAEVWLRSRIRKHPESLKMLTQRLQAKGLSREEASQAIKALSQEHENLELDLCAAAADSLGRRFSDLELERKLLSRGFSSSTLRRWHSHGSADE